MSEGFEGRNPTPAGTAGRFAELRAGFDKQAAVPEANRCLFCFDAPCMQACPTHIDVPRFIKKIATGNVMGSAGTILEANVLGGEMLAGLPGGGAVRGACVLHRYNRQPIEMGRLQRFAMGCVSCGGGPGAV